MGLSYGLPKLGWEAGMGCGVSDMGGKVSSIKIVCNTWLHYYTVISVNMNGWLLKC